MIQTIGVGEFLKPALLPAPIFMLSTILGTVVATTAMWQNRRIQICITEKWFHCEKQWQKKALLIASSASIYAAFAIGPIVAMAACLITLLGIHVVSFPVAFSLSILAGVASFFPEVKIYRFANGKQMDVNSYLAMYEENFSGSPCAFDRRDSPPVQPHAGILVFDLERPNPPGDTPPRPASSEV